MRHRWSNCEIASALSATSALSGFDLVFSLRLSVSAVRILPDAS
jgi:hypothetical protein